MFCPECGATDVEMIDGICKNCFLKKFQLMEIPENITVTICKHCNAKLEEGKWKDEYIPEEEIIYRALERNITISDLAENEEIELEIDQMRGTIAECYVEAVATVLIQLRADDRELEDEEIATAEEIINRTLDKQFKKDKLAYIPQVAKLKEGNDYYIGSLKSAKKVVEHLKEEFGGTTKESPRLISEDKSTGKGLYRIWIALRLPKFVKDDFVKYHDNVYQVSDVDGNRIQVINLENQDIIALKWREYDSIEKIEHLEGVQKAIITAKSPSMMQILDPDDYSPIDLEMNEKLEKYNIGEEIDVIKIDGKIYII